MNADLAVGLAQNMIYVAVLVSSPVLAVALIVGLIVSVLQVATQIQEMTLTFVPKIASVVVVLMIFGGWMLSVLTDYAITLYKTIPDLV